MPKSHEHNIRFVARAIEDSEAAIKQIKRGDLDSARVLLSSANASIETVLRELSPETPKGS